MNSRWKGGKIEENGYSMVRLQPDDFFFSMVRDNGYVYEHRLVMAKHLGRSLHSWELVHHKDRNKRNNNIGNLQLVTSERHEQLTILESKIDRLTNLVTGLRNEVKLLRWENKELKRQQV